MIMIIIIIIIIHININITININIIDDIKDTERGVGTLTGALP